MKKCKYCKEEFTPKYSTLERVCDKMECKQEEYSKPKKSKKIHAYSSKIKKGTKSELKLAKEEARTVCHLYIRTRDKDKLCPCCNKPLGKNYHAGHFLPSANNSTLRYHEDNIHGQRLDCNLFASGDSGDYEKNLRLRIGNSKVDWLLDNRGGVVKRTTEDYEEIQNYYKDKLERLREERNEV